MVTNFHDVIVLNPLQKSTWQLKSRSEHYTIRDTRQRVLAPFKHKRNWFCIYDKSIQTFPYKAALLGCIYHVFNEYILLCKLNNSGSANATTTQSR